LRYAPQLDGVRALCVALTITNHIGPTTRYVNGTLGVDVFFALSGFLITTLLLEEQRLTARVCLRCFYVRRVFRIAPLYYLTIGLYAVTAYLLWVRGIDADRFAQMKAVAPMVLLFLGEFPPQAAGTLLGHTWTLGIEEKYYILWPLLFAAARALRYRALIGLVALAAAGFWVLLPVRLAIGYGGIAIGSLMALVHAEESSPIRRLIVAIPTAAIAMLLSIGYCSTVVTHNSLASHCLFTLVSAVLVMSLVVRPSRVRELLASKPFVYIGKRTYAIYLLHVLVANAVIGMLTRTHWDFGWPLRGGLTLAGSIIVASLAKILLEDPMIKAGRRISARLQAAPGSRPQDRFK
jgi:peptidoglycan/LPS O-acetylase OafA/YrhL